MKITDRVKGISGVESAYWDSNQNQLTIYYSDSVPKETIKAQVVAEVRDVGLVNAVDKFVFISLDTKNKEGAGEASPNGEPLSSPQQAEGYPAE